MKKEDLRMEWIDISKGLGIILVIFGHIHSGKVRELIYSFHMPLFFFLSGAVFKIKSDFKTFFIKKVKALVRPYFYFGSVILLFFIFIDFILGKCTFLKEMKLLLLFLLQRRFLVLWFISCLFWLNLIAYFLFSSKISERNKIIFSCISAITGQLYYKLGGKPLFWNVDVCLMALIFFHLGYLYRLNYTYINEKIKKINIKLLVFLSLAINISFGYFSKVISGKTLEMFQSEYGFFPFSYISALAGIFFIIFITKYYFKNTKIIKYLGENSLIYYIWHQSIAMPIVYKSLNLLNVDFLLSKNNVFLTTIYELLVLILVLVSLTLCNFIIKHTFLKFMIEK